MVKGTKNPESDVVFSVSNDRRTISATNLKRGVLFVKRDNGGSLKRMFCVDKLSLSPRGKAVSLLVGKRLMKIHSVRGVSHFDQLDMIGECITKEGLDEAKLSQRVKPNLPRRNDRGIEICQIG